MVELQHNFTTPEQSKRLLALGVPADSADCIWYNPYYDGTVTRLAEISVWKGKYPQRIDKYTLPCWSVGRLIEIYCLCTGVEDIKIGLSEISLVELMVKLIEILVNAKSLNFSKLEA